jgi:hypothetical protein
VFINYEHVEWYRIPCNAPPFVFSTKLHIHVILHMILHFAVGSRAHIPSHVLWSAWNKLSIYMLLVTLRLCGACLHFTVTTLPSLTHPFLVFERRIYLCVTPVSSTRITQMSERLPHHYGEQAAHNSAWNVGFEKPDKNSSTFYGSRRFIALLRGAPSLDMLLLTFISVNNSPVCNLSNTNSLKF